MIFDTRVNGIPCQCEVTAYIPSKPMRITGPGMGDCDPPEDEVFEYAIRDRRGRRATWLDKYVSDDVDMRLLCEFTEKKAEYFTEPDYDE